MERQAVLALSIVCVLLMINSSMTLSCEPCYREECEIVDGKTICEQVRLSLTNGECKLH